MLCKDNMASLVNKFKKKNAKHIFPSFSFFIYLFFLKKKKTKTKTKTKTTYHEMHECYAMQILKTNKTKQ